MGKSFTQDYFLCSLNPKGAAELVNSDEGAAILFASAILELQFAGIIELDNKKRFVVGKDLPPQLNYLQPVYDFIKDNKPKKIESLGEDFYFNDKLPKALFTSVGESLVQLGVATEKTNQGLFKNKTYILPEEKTVISIIEKIRAELLEDGKITDEVVILSALLEKKSLIRNYFSKYERDLIKQRLKEIRKSDSYQLITKLLDAMDSWIAIFTTTFITMT